ncbi:MAG: radical SAM family heme chaperone HemW [Bacteroidia bacterium]|nr:radical SAM family heme chaperone HemW [Bacteroidia bacterium]MCZ2249032.1 radical SAM family heme chaperone HemW [Bacteroidia bacterium]
MAGIYIHIPFCKQACTYCDFYFSTSPAMINPVADGIIAEIDIRKHFFDGNAPTIIETIYFGGGTPSTMQPELLDKIINKIYTTFKISALPEITLEVNPDDCNIERIKAWQKMGINRISCGIQSFEDEDLKFMKRSHNAVQATDAIKRMQDIGFGNINIDLIYGLPNMDNLTWAANLEKAIQINIQHLSCYCLTVEEKTLLSHWVKNKRVKLDEEMAANNFEYLMRWANDNNFEHYEISNFCMPGYRSKHNSSYWQGKSYLGLGPAAHSYNGKIRQYNIPNMFTYLKEINQGKTANINEELSPLEKYNEKIMIGLRLAEGISFTEIKEYLNSVTEQHFQKALKRQNDLQNIQLYEHRFALTHKGKLIADSVIEDFFAV